MQKIKELPLIQEFRPDSDTQIAVWKIEEPDDFFLSKLKLDDYDRETLAGFRWPTRKTEWLASRYLIRYLCGTEAVIHLRKDDLGRPYLENLPFSLSLSHTNLMAAVMLTGHPMAGLDLERMNPKVLRVADKFVHPDEMSFTRQNEDLEKLIILWSAKESVYKAYGKKELEFREHINLLDQVGETLKIGVKKNSFDKIFEVHFRLVENCALTWTAHA